MPKKIKITGITIKLSNAREANISLAEARELYDELDEIFASKSPGLTFPNAPVYPYGGIPRNPQWMDAVWCKTNGNTVDPTATITTTTSDRPPRKKVFIRSN